MRYLRKLTLIVSVMALLSAISYQLSAGATAQGGAITIEPFYQEIVIPDKAKNSYFIKLTNNTNKQQNFRLKTADFGSLDETGGVAFIGITKPDVNYKYGLTTWLSLDQQFVVLRPGETQQIEFAIIFRDSKNRLNTGMVCARLVAAKNRLKERVDSILYWLDRYGEWGEAISIFLTFHRHYLPRLEIRLAQLSENEIFQNEKNGNNAATIARVENIMREIDNLQFFGGWRKWAMQCNKDLALCRGHVSKGNIAEAAYILKKIRQATRLKLVQYEIHELLLRIDMDQMEKTQNSPDHIKTIQIIEEVLDSIDETGFRTPVIDELREKLSAASALLAKDMGPKDHKEMKDCLRFAYQKI